MFELMICRCDWCCPGAESAAVQWCAWRNPYLQERLS